MINAKNLNIWKGAFFEYLACAILLLKGYSILRLNYKKKYTSQLDIIVEKKGKIIIVEVKFRKDFQSNEYAISYGQKDRLRKSALKLQSAYNREVRVDAIFFGLTSPFYKHVKDVL